MKKLKKLGIIASLFLICGVSFADVNFSGMAGGTTGINGTISSSPTFEIPLSGFAAAQMNFGSWGIFRANLGLATNNLAGGDIFTGQDATIMMNELSFVFSKSTGKVKNYFSFYLGTYEAVGCDEFLQRQFGIEPYTSLITKNSATLSTGLPLYNNYGTGFSYTMNFANKPGAIGASIYINQTSDKIPQLNFDLRTAWTTKIFTVDFATGIGAPLQNKYAGENVFLLIDSLYLHGGINLLLGSRYTHGLLLQAGIQNIEIAKGSLNRNFNGETDLTLLAEFRIYSKLLKTRVTIFNIPSAATKNMLYINDPLGVAVTLFSDTIPVKNNNMTVGGHLIGALANENIASLSSSAALQNGTPNINVYLTPFVDIPIGSGTLEVMAQFGALDMLNNFTFRYQTKIGYKKAF